MAASLTSDALQEGNDLLHDFEAMGVEVTGAAWLHVIGVPETVAWRLFMFAPQVDTVGTRVIDDHLFSRLGWPDSVGAVSPFDVFVISPAEWAYDELLELADGLSLGQVAPVQAEWRGLQVDSVFPYRLGQPRAAHTRTRRGRHRSTPGRDAA